MTIWRAPHPFKPHLKRVWGDWVCFAATLGTPVGAGATIYDAFDDWAKKWHEQEARA